MKTPLHLAFVSALFSFVFSFFDRIFRRHCGCSPELVPWCTMFKVNPAISNQIFLLPLFNFLTPDFLFSAHLLRGPAFCTRVRKPKPPSFDSTPQSSRLLLLLVLYHTIACSISEVPLLLHAFQLSTMLFTLLPVFLASFSSALPINSELTDVSIIPTYQAAINKSLCQFF
jgi:hypothetical protein